MSNVLAGTKGFVARPLHVRFWEKVEISEGCWSWRGGKSERGYGRIYVNGRSYPAHRLAWELAHGQQMPKHLDACHSCDNPSCVYSEHVWPGTAHDNMRDAASKGLLGTNNSRKTKCLRGHEYVREKTRGYRRCYQCANDRRRKYPAKP